jgi:hypothetical protein
MNYKMHLLIGFIVAVAYAFCLNWLKVDIGLLDYIWFPIIWFIYSQLPDIDSQNSKIRWIFTFSFLISIIYFAILQEYVLVIVSAVCLLFIWVMKWIKGFGHRGIFHRHYVGAIFAVPMYMISGWHFILCVLMYSTHLLMDAISDRFGKKEA